MTKARDYVRKIKRICVKDIDPECRVILFGSIARGNYRIDSDIDVLIITEKGKSAWDKAVISSLIKEKIGFGDPLELHVVTKKEYEEWYKNSLTFMRNFDPTIISHNSYLWAFILFIMTLL
ncbi:nucleotidyltransferase domain-containing protein [Sulfurisphaera ohwakuensis]|uniref:nucleotidyltransferase domain-containing protein n=1 Tax=Sulfurisphaera ohwakuensis TaxID=69656 RepID=UPI0021A76EB8